MSVLSLHVYYQVCYFFYIFAYLLVDLFIYLFIYQRFIVFYQYLASVFAGSGNDLLITLFMSLTFRISVLSLHVYYQVCYFYYIFATSRILWFVSMSKPALRWKVFYDAKLYFDPLFIYLLVDFFIYLFI